MTDIKLLNYFPKDTPKYMYQAWVSCFRWASNNDNIFEQFMRENERPLLKKDHQSLELFAEWFNKNIWGVMPK